MKTVSVLDFVPLSLDLSNLVPHIVRWGDVVDNFANEGYDVSELQKIHPDTMGYITGLQIKT